MIPNPSLNSVPEEHSLLSFVDEEWTRLQRAIYDDLPYEEVIRGIEESIATRKEQIEKQVLDPAFDWKYDFDRAAFRHRFNLTWIEHHKSTRNRYIDFWKSSTRKNYDYLRELALNGMKSMLLVHGGVALGALGVLTQKAATSQISLTAKVALGFALLGMVMLGAGQLIMVNRVMALNSRIEGKLAGSLTWRKIAAFPRYFNRHSWPLKYADWMIYGSIFWFATYATILYLMLVAS